MHSESDTESFTSAQDDLNQSSEAHKVDTLKPREEAKLVSESNDTKLEGNSLFARAAYSDAVQTYDRAIASCPSYLDYEIAVLKSNIAACHLKLKEWNDAIDAATISLDNLERLDPTTSIGSAEGKKQQSHLDPASTPEPRVGTPSSMVEEVDDATATNIENLAKSGRSRDDAQKIRIKALLRRAKAREELGGWSALQGADEDYRKLAAFHDLSSMDRATVRKALGNLSPRLEKAKQAEMGEMVGKLKDLGNGLLKPFGLSTENFQFTQDPTSGGYSMQFNQGNKTSE